MKLTVNKIKHVLTTDIDTTQHAHVKELDGFVFTCISSAAAALGTAAPPGFTNFERDHLQLVVNGMRHSHRSIRNLLLGGPDPSAVDALAIARLQLETLYSLCFMLQDAANVRLFLKYGWKKKYVRFLLDREERRNLPRFDEYFSKTAAPFIEELRKRSGVTTEEKLTIEQEQIGTPVPAGFVPVPIERFPTPRAVIRAIRNSDQKDMLERLYPDYEYLCSFAHGDTESSLFRTILDSRLPFKNMLGSGQVEDFFQRQVAETPLTYSIISAVQVATEVAAIYPANVELLAKVTEAWNWLIKGTLYASPVWERRAKKILPLI
ncbi:MAG TPA: hypothetical protein VEW69_11535 [Alphaproteobacteria bacterium]|nr:hypothetical protein [Alphaproteobacteria bacterium]